MRIWTPRRIGDWCVVHRFRLVPATFSLGYVAFLAWWGTADVESLYKFERSYGSRYLGLRIGDTAVGAGLRTLGGVPVYDITQGFGYRLPLQGSLGQTPWVFLRWIASAELIQILSLVVPLAVCSWTLTRFLAPVRSDRAVARLAFGHTALLGPLLLFTVRNEWTPTAVSFCGRVILICLSLGFGRISGDRAGGSRSALTVGLLAIGFVVTGHPGEWPLAVPAVVLGGSSIVVSLRSNWWRVGGRSSGRSWVVLAPLVGMILLAATCVMSEVLYEISRPAIDQLRSPFSLALPASKLPDVVELVGSERVAEISVLIVMAAVGPVLQLVLNTQGRYEFISLLLVIPIAAGLSGVRRTRTRWTLCRGALLALMTLSWTSLELVAFPTSLRASAAWLHAPQLMIILVLCALIVTEERRRIVPRSGAMIRLASIAGLLMVCLQPVALLRGTERVGPAVSRWRSADASVWPRGERAAAVSEYPWRNAWGLAPGWVRSFEGYPALENESKIRNASTLSMREHLGQFVSGEGLASCESSMLRDFAAVRRVVMAEGDLPPEIDSCPSTEDGEESIKALDVGGDTRLFALDRLRFHTFTLDAPSRLRSSERCPLVDRPECVAELGTRDSAEMSRPPWRLGDGTTLATYQFELSGRRWAVVLPIDYDPTLRIALRDSRTAIRTHSHLGLLVAELPHDVSRGIFEISIKPDLRMWARVLATYLYTVALVVVLCAHFGRIFVGRLR